MTKFKFSRNKIKTKKESAVQGQKSSVGSAEDETVNGAFQGWDQELDAIKI